ncbi:putative lipoprotein, rSAM/lipoprotein system [Anaerohalosphaera lusitana]|uniref:Putative lipoprotein, rSAM/lipoprotein system n=1 Tax=Anaerohalosphaera lusitana TaxID=1936003 RepID=A0A1U9NQT8_9BACT|nr:carboxypeptidase regulatory-like domain-containing protein [Anaerohalosphaera lusitana]AQT70185.1 putative lipoprotein, rSAM/lipoprotein system [Anaerohalosphaera lusitana]
MKTPERKFEDRIARLELDDQPRQAFSSELRSRMLAEFASAPAPRGFRKVWRQIMTSPITKYAAAAIFIAAVLTAVNLLANNETADRQNIATDPPTRTTDAAGARPEDTPEKDIAAKDQPDAGEDQLELAARFYANHDVDGLIDLLETGSEDAKTASAAYLADLGSDKAIKPLQKAAQNYTGDSPNPFAAAAEKLQKKQPEPQPNSLSDETVNKSARDDTTTAKSESNKDATENKITNPQKGRLVRVLVTEKQTGLPLEKATVWVEASGSAAWTNSDGRCDLRWKRDEDEVLKVWARKNGFVRMLFCLTEENSPGVEPLEVVYEMEPASTIGGIILNERDEPIANVHVTVEINHEEHLDSPEIDVYEEVKSNSNGKWEFSGVPAELQLIEFTLKHSNYQTSERGTTVAQDFAALRNREYKMDLEDKYTLSGLVVNENGSPIPNARVQLGAYYFNRDRKHRMYTDQSGRFKFDDIEIRKSERMQFVTVSADGYAPDLKKVSFKKPNAEVKFVLKPGNTIHGRVVDPDGNPISEAKVSAGKWRNEWYHDLQSLDWKTKTDATGRFAWKDAPPDQIELIVEADGYLKREIEGITPSENGYEFVIHPQIRVHGKVVNWQTGQPIRNFSIRRHQGHSIHSSEDVRSSDGCFETKFTEGESFKITVLAEGCKPLTSREVTLGEQDVELVFEMVADSGIDCQVLNMDGEPVAGVRAILLQSALYMINNEFNESRLRYHPNIVTDSDGQFHFDPVEGDYEIVIVHDSGYAHLHSRELPNGGHGDIITLRPYARIRGSYYEGAKPAAKKNIGVDYPYSIVPREDFLNLRYSATTDEDGQFEFDGLFAGKARILVEPRVEVDVEAGKTHEVVLGGTGFTIKGQVLDVNGDPFGYETGRGSLNIEQVFTADAIPSDEIPVPTGVESMSFLDTMKWFGSFISSQEGKEWRTRIERHYAFDRNYSVIKLNEDGIFQQPNFLPGRYRLTFSAEPWADSTFDRYVPDYGNEFMKASAIIEVPEYESIEELDTPIDIGTLHCRPAPLEPGQKAPYFEVPALKKSGLIRSSDYYGKHVVLTFTNPYLNIDQPEKMATLKPALEGISARNDVQIINVAAELVPWQYMREKMIKDCTLPGIYGRTPNNRSKIAFDYDSSGLPYTVIIGPDGRIVAVDVQPGEIAGYLETADIY